MMVGSAGFMAPEQVTGARPGGRHLRLGRDGRVRGQRAAAVRHRGTHAILYRIMHGAPDIAAVPPALQPLVVAALAKDPQRRPTARQLLDQLTDPPPARTVLLRPCWPTPGRQPSPMSARPRSASPCSARPSLASPHHQPSTSEPQPGESYISEPRTGRPRADEGRTSRPGPARRPPNGSLLFEPAPASARPRALGHQATLLAGGPGGWLAIGPQAIWTSPDGMSWTLASTHGVSPPAARRLGRG